MSDPSTAPSSIVPHGLSGAGVPRRRPRLRGIVPVLWALATSCGGSAATGKGPDGGGTGGGAQSAGIGGAGVTGGGLAGGGLAGGGLAGGGGVGGGAVAGTPVPLDGSPVYARLVRLTNAQWMH